MRLCKACAFPARPWNTACARCGRAWPWFTSRRTRPRAGTATPVTRGKQCPRCGHETSRRPTPLLLRPVRWLAGDRCSYRRCTGCRWKGLSFHPPSSPAHRRRHHHTHADV